MGYYLLLLYWALRGALFLSKGCFALRSDLLLTLLRCPKFLRCLRRIFLFLPPAAPFLSTAKEMGERTPAKTAFLHFLSTLRQYANLQPFTTRSQNRFHVVSYDELTSLLRRCRSCGGTVEPKALFGVGTSGSGAVAETVL